MRAPSTKTEIRKEQIAQAALDLIARYGFHRLNVAAVAREVGVVPAALYRHYQGVDEVLEAVLDLAADRLLANVSAVREATLEPLERLHLLLQRHVQLVRSGGPIPRVVFSEEMFAHCHERRERMHQVHQRYLAAVAELIREGQKAGCIRADLEAGTLAVMFLGLVQPADTLWRASDSAFDLTSHTETAWGLFSSMLIARSLGAGQTKPGTPILAPPPRESPKRARVPRYQRFEEVSTANATSGAR